MQRETLFRGDEKGERQEDEPTNLSWVSPSPSWLVENKRGKEEKKRGKKISLFFGNRGKGRCVKNVFSSHYFIFFFFFFNTTLHVVPFSISHFKQSTKMADWCV